MASRAPRHDRYGRPLPSLAPAGTEAMGERPANVTQRRRLATILTEVCEGILRRDMTAEVTLRFKVVDGVIQGNSLHVGVMRHYSTEEE